LLWFVVQGFVFLKMIAITDVTAPLLAWFFGWTFCAAIALVAFRLVLGVVCRRSLGVAGMPSRIAIVGGGEWLERIVESLRGAGAARYRFVGAYRTTGETVALGGNGFVATDLASFAASARAAAP
jgi:hypothetical protein